MVGGSCLALPPVSPRLVWETWECGEALAGLRGVCRLGECSRAVLGWESSQAPLLHAENHVGVTFFL